MDYDDKLKLIYENSASLHKYFLNWRYKLLVGYIIVVSAIGYFIFTWLQKPENFSVLNYIITCLCGMLITFFFFLINHRITRLLWKCQNEAYLIEKELGFHIKNENIYAKHGVYGKILTEEIRKKIDDGNTEDLEKSNSGLFNPFNHSGILNWFFIIVAMIFFILLFQTSSLNSAKSEWLKNRTKINKTFI